MADPTVFLNGRVRLFAGDCMEVLAELPENSVDAVCTDPPYHLTSIVKRFGAEGAAEAKSNGTGVYKRSSAGFMGKVWDGGDIAFRPETWAAVLRVMKPGAHLVAFAAPKNAHRMICAIEDAGFEIRDGLMWLFGSGFPKSHDISKAIDRAAGVTGSCSDGASGKGTETVHSYGDGLNVNFAPRPTYSAASDDGRAWAGWGTALKPAYEPIVLARKPLSEPSIAANVLRWGTGALNIDGARIPTAEDLNGGAYSGGSKRPDDASSYYTGTKAGEYQQPSGRWPANIIHDGSDEVVGAFPETVAATSRTRRDFKGWKAVGELKPDAVYEDGGGSAARFFYTAKADAGDRAGSRHPTVKPLDLIQYLCRLITPPRGTVLDLFAGTGTTGEAAWREGFRAIMIEREAEYVADIARRMEWAMLGPESRARAQVKLDVERGKVKAEALPLFGGETNVGT